MKQGCPFDLLQRCEAWKGCATQFHEGVDLAKQVLPDDIIKHIEGEGNSPPNELLIINAVDTLKQHCHTHIEGLRERLAEYDRKYQKTKHKKSRDGPRSGDGGLNA